VNWARLDRRFASTGVQALGLIAVGHDGGPTLRSLGDRLLASDAGLSDWIHGDRKRNEGWRLHRQGGLRQLNTTTCYSWRKEAQTTVDRGP